MTVCSAGTLSYSAADPGKNIADEPDAPGREGMQIARSSDSSVSGTSCSGPLFRAVRNAHRAVHVELLSMTTSRAAPRKMFISSFACEPELMTRSITTSGAKRFSSGALALSC